MATSQPIKHEGLEERKDGDVTELPGIGQALGQVLKQKGFHTIFDVRDKFLSLDKDKARFKKWLEEEIGANRDQRKRCYNYMKEFCDP